MCEFFYHLFAGHVLADPPIDIREGPVAVCLPHALMLLVKFSDFVVDASSWGLQFEYKELLDRFVNDATGCEVDGEHLLISLPLNV